MKQLGTKAEGRAARKAARQEAKRARQASTVRLRDLGPTLWALIGAAHPAQAVAMGLGVGVAALLADRPFGHAAFAGLGVLVTQLVLGLHNDSVDEAADALTETPRKPVASGRISSNTASFTALCLSLLSIPIALQNGTFAGIALLATLVVGFLSNVFFRKTVVSFLPWAITFALLAAYLSYGGWGIGRHGGPPTWQVAAFAALLGVGVHLLLALPDLVADNKAGMRHLPLRIALKTGATKLLVGSALFTAAALAGLLYAASTVGLRQ